MEEISFRRETFICVGVVKNVILKKLSLFFKKCLLIDYRLYWRLETGGRSQFTVHSQQGTESGIRRGRGTWT